MARFRSHRHLPQIMHRVRFAQELPQDLRTIMARRRFKPIQAESSLAKSFSERRTPHPTVQDQLPTELRAELTTSTSLYQTPCASPPSLAVETPVQDDIVVLIPKPAGEAGRPNAGGYSLEIKLKELGWRTAEIESLQKHIKSLCNVHLDTAKPYSEQDAELKQVVINKVKLAFPILEAYVNTWPVTEMMKSVLKAARDKLKREKVQKAASVNLLGNASHLGPSGSSARRVLPLRAVRSSSTTLSDDSSVAI
ncbi:hypothetical protein SISSUDRAFT_1067781 [Sistotremastrum suecicum HHB10207 ss-3]|uniref:Uncharacterized protein n=1 Tax=Sistotremastrum suecicum HHB10207 ss-3 TaxID=1314776 RepID=A0A165WQ13_9AGAM|nr:hypothetical protein SISSUDRAFT_1067781 [Sistotremastrum suecicum HHB10207 ss-3]